MGADTDHLLSSAQSALQSVPAQAYHTVMVEVRMDSLHQYLDWQPEFPQHPLLVLFDEVADSRLPLEVPGDGGGREVEGAHDRDGSGGTSGLRNFQSKSKLTLLFSNLLVFLFCTFAFHSK